MGYTDMYGAQMPQPQAAGPAPVPGQPRAPNGMNLYQDTRGSNYGRGSVIPGAKDDSGQVRDLASRMAFGNQALQGAVGQVNDPSRWTGLQQGNQAIQSAGNYYAGILSGSTPSLSKQAAGTAADAALRNMQSVALANQNGMAPGLTQRNLLDAATQASLQGQQQAAMNGLQEQQMAVQGQLGAGQALAQNAINQQQTQGNQAISASGALAQAGYQAGQLGQQADIANQGNSTQLAGIKAQQEIAQAQLAQQQDQFQQQFDRDGSVYNRYVLPGLSAAGSVLSAILPGRR